MDCISIISCWSSFISLCTCCKGDPDVLDALHFLKQKEIIHFQRFGEALRGMQDKLVEKKFVI